MLSEIIRIFVIKVITFPFKEIRRFFKMVRPDVWLLEGDELTSRHPLSIAYIGSDERHRNYLSKLAFGSSFKKRRTTTDWVWKIPEHIKNNEADCSVAVFEINRFLESFCRLNNALIMPKWVDTALDLSKPLQQVFPRKVFREMGRLIRKNSYSYEVTKNPHLFDEFYYTMYLPFINKTFDDLAYQIDYLWYKRTCEHYELLLLKQEDTVVAGVILDYSKKNVLMKYVGYKDGDYTYVKEGAFNAMLYFTVSWLKENNYNELGLGLSTSFLKDGRLKFKTLKGARIVDSNLSLTPEKNVALAFLKNEAGLMGFLLNNPFIFYSEHHTRYAALFLKVKHTFSHEDIHNLLAPFSRYHGIEKWCIYIWGEEVDYEKLLHSDEASPKAVIACAQSLFSDVSVLFSPFQRR